MRRSVHSIHRLGRSCAVREGKNGNAQEVLLNIYVHEYFKETVNSLAVC